ncbi:MAG TPA: OmpA family protein, partial [Rhodospirillaceae bacterium]|nr:OmpA family protein [Rhodospirillaceae bacterium]
FGEGTAALSSADVASLKEIAALARERKGSLRLVGHSASSRLDVDPAANREANRLLAARRADAVAQQLVRLGVPAGRIYAGAAADTGMTLAGGASSGGESTEIYIDY